MPQDPGDLYDLEDMSDGDIRDLIRNEFRDTPELDPDRIDIQVEDGFVTLSGRVGTELELQQAELTVSDVLGISNYSNEIVVDELVRGERAEAADEAVVEDAENQAQLGESGERTQPSADHLLEDVEGDAHGTKDMKKAIQQGQSYNPPDRPTREGAWSEENH